MELFSGGTKMGKRTQGKLRTVVAWFLTGVSLLFFTACQAKIYCVGTKNELEFALREAETSNRADIIRLIQGTYYGNFVYRSAESDRLTIEGGYLKGCSHRESDRGKTVLDGGGKGTVLELSTPRVAPEYVLDGLTIQGGKPTRDKPGGIILRSNGGKIIMKNCVVNGGIARGTGGVTVQDGSVKGGIRKTW
jgi:hypothetical protein